MIKYLLTFISITTIYFLYFYIKSTLSKSVIHVDENNTITPIDQYTPSLRYTTTNPLWDIIEVGVSSQQSPMVAYEFIKNPSNPTFLIISNVHGNEVMGYYMIQHFINDLESQLEDGKDNSSFITNDVNYIIVPTVNPDGFFANTRHDSSNHDPNRDYHADSSLDKSLETSHFKQYFTSIIKKYNMCFSVNLHGGALCVSYPMDSHPAAENEYSKSTHDDHYITATRLYVQHHTRMTDAYTSKGGYINGADWYHITGSIQDWFVNNGVPSITIELGNVKNPLVTNVDYTELTNQQVITIESCWQENKLALEKLVEFVATMPFNL